MKRCILFIILTLIIFALFAEPMSGVILVGGEISHYDTLQEAIDAIAENGISGDIEIATNTSLYFNEPVLISGINQTGDYNILIKAISGIGNRSTFVNDAVTSWQDNYIFKIENSKNITIQGAKFETVVSGYGNMIVLGAGSQNITIDDCIFEGAEIYSSSYHNSVVLSGGVLPVVSNVTIKNSTFNNNYNHITTQTGSYINNPFDVSILDCTLTTGYYSIGLTRVTNPIVKGNTINNTNVGIAVSGSGNIEIANNRVNASISGIGVNSFNINSSAKGIYNNIVTVNSSEAAGISIGNGNNMKIYHNSIINYSNHWNAKALSFSGTGHQIKNNSIINYARDAYAFSGINFDSNVFEHNNIYSRAINIARIGNTYYQTIESFFAEYFPYANSYNISIDPMFGNDLEDQITESLWIDNKGTFAEGYETDFYGFERSTTTPDIGAIEFTGNPAYTPMSGQYWVGDNTGAAFTTLQDAFDALMIRGVEANTLIKLNRTDGDFAEQLELLTVPGISSQRALFIESNTEYFIKNRIIATGTQEEPYLFKIGRVNHLSIKNVAFDNQSPTYGNGIYFDSYATDITIDDCMFTQASVRTGGDNIHLSDKAMVIDFELKNSIINSGRFGIYVNNTNSSNITIKNSDFTNQNYAIHTSNVKNLTIIDNIISGFNNTGILANLTTNGIIERNRIFGSGTGINFSSISSQQWETGTLYPNLIANNIIKLSSGSSALWVGGNYIDVQHNNIDIKGVNSTGIYQYNQSPYIDIFSNAIRAEKYAVEIVHPINSENFRMNTNCYFVDGAYFVRLGDNYYYSISQWKTADSTINEYSIEADPLFTENGYTTSPLMFSRGFGSNRINDDIDGNPRDIYPDIGANENSPGIPPSFYYAYDKVLTVGVGKDYESLHDCFYDLERFGFFRWNNENSHKDTLRIKLDAGTYSDYYTLNHIPRDTHETETQSQSWLVIEPANPDDVVIFTYDETTTENKPLLTINGASRFIIKNIRFENTTKSYNKMIDFRGKVNRFEFDNNEFFIDENLNSTYSIVMQDAYCRNAKFNHNSFENGQYGLYLRTGSYLPRHNWVALSHNTFENTDNSLYVNNIDEVFLFKNIFNQFYTGVYAANSTGLFNIISNTFTSNRNPSAGTRALDLISLKADSEGEGLFVLNNVIRINNNSIYTSYGMVLSSNNGANISNNNIIVSQKSILNTSAPVHFYNTTSGVKFFNNLLVGLDKARAFEFNSYSENYFDLISNNCFYSEWKSFARHNSNYYKSYDEFAEAHPNFVTNSFSAYPFLDENNYAQSNYLAVKGLVPQIGVGHDGSYLYYDIGASLVNHQPLDPFSGTIQVDYNSRHNSLMSAYVNLMKRGINGPTEILLPTDEHIGQYELRYIPMLSEDASLTIKSVSNSQSAELKHSSTSAQDNFVFNVISSKNLKLSGLRMENEGTDFAKVINLHGFNDNLVIEDCILAGFDSASTNNKEQSLIDARNNFSNNLTIKNNNLYKGTYAFLNESYSSAEYTSDYILIEDNTFNQNVFGIDLQKADAIQISRNRFHLMKNTAIKLGYFLSGITINNNRIDYLNGMGIHLIHTGNDSYKAIYNNSIRTFGTSNNLSPNIQLESINNIDVIYNTMRHNGSSNNAGFVANSGVTNLKYINNIAYKQNNGHAASFGNPSGVNEASNNLFFNAQGTNTVNWGGQNLNQTSDFDNYDLHQNSIIANPLFVDITNIIESGSPAVGAGLASSWIMTDIDGTLRGSNPAIGAHEYVEPVFNPPLNLTATPGLNRVILNWEEPEGLMPAGFNIYRDSVKINVELITLNTYTDIVESDVELSYFVTAVYINPFSGESNASNIVLATPVTPVFYPPTSLMSTAHYDKISLTWLPPINFPQGNSNLRRNSENLNQRNLNFVNYKVYRNEEFITETTTGAYDDYDIETGISYTYYVTAVYQDPDGESAPSTSTVNMLLTPNYIAPENLTANPAIGTITLNWEHPNHGSVRSTTNLSVKNTLISKRSNMIIAGYNVYRDSVLVNENVITELNYTDMNLQFGNTYTYFVTAVYSYPEGESGASNTISSATLPQSFTVFLEVNPVTGGTVDGEGEYDQGSQVTITATPNTGYQFVNWVEHSIRHTQQNLLTTRNSHLSKKSLNRENSLTDSVYTFIMPANNKSFTAIFELNSYNLTLVANPENAGTVSGPETFNYQQILNADDLTIENVGGYLFTGWTSDIEGNNPVVFPIAMPSEDVTWYAQFELIPYDVTLTAVPESGGVLTGGGEYVLGDTVTVTATANEGYEFIHWSLYDFRNNISRNRELLVTEPVYEFTMPAHDVNLFAHFAMTSYNLTLVANPENAGTVSGPETFNYQQIINTEDLTIENVGGYLFTGWTSDIEGNNLVVFPIAMPSEDVTWYAQFELIPYEVTLTAVPESGGVLTGGGEYVLGDTVTVTATANEGYEFIHWSLYDFRNNISRNRELLVTEPVYEFTMPAHDVNLFAHFAMTSYNLTLIANPEIAGTVSGPETFNFDTVINETDLTFTENTGWSFSGWTTDLEGNNPVEFPVTMPAEDVTWHAQFEQTEYTVALSINPENAGTVTGNGTYHYNDSVTVTASANEGYQFMYWASETEGRDILSSSNQTLTRKNIQRQRDVVSTDSVYTFVMPENNVNLTAHFELILVFNPPQNLLAEASYTDILLTWAAPENRNRALVGYKVYRDNMAVTELIAESMFTDTEVLPNVEYTYFVKAVYQNPDGESVPSNEVAASLLIPVFNPPVNLEGEALENTIILTWESPQDIPENMTLAGYKVYRDSLAITNVIETTQYSDTNIILENTYTYFVTAVYVNPDGESEASNEVVIDYVSENDITLMPVITKLNNNYPNPFNPITTISFSLAKASNVQIEIFDARGRKVKTLINKEYHQGNHTLTWNAKDDNGKELSSGMYFYRMKTNAKIETRKMLLIK